MRNFSRQHVSIEEFCCANLISTTKRDDMYVATFEFYSQSDFKIKYNRYVLDYGAGLRRGDPVEILGKSWNLGVSSKVDTP